LYTTVFKETKQNFSRQAPITPQVHRFFCVCLIFQKQTNPTELKLNMLLKCFYHNTSQEHGKQIGGAWHQLSL
jgi:hypothetical protein